MCHSKKFIQQRGMSLIEVLVTLVVLGVGLISMAKLQPTVMENSGLARARAVAVQLAEQKIEDLRSFNKLSSAGTTAAFQSIGNDTGGFLPSSLVSGTLTAVNLSDSNVSYYRTWTASNWYFPITNNGNPAIAVQSGVVTPAWPDYKIVTVKVAWTDQEGASQEIQLKTIISSAEPSRSGLIVEP